MASNRSCSTCTDTLGQWQAGQRVGLVGGRQEASVLLTLAGGRPHGTPGGGTEVSVTEEGSTSPSQDGLDQAGEYHVALKHIAPYYINIASRCIIILTKGGLDQQL